MEIIKRFLLLFCALVSLNVMPTNNDTPVAECPKQVNRPKKKLYIVIHGTWAHESAWYLPGGDFFKTLKKRLSLSHENIISFTWSGRNAHAYRVIAGQQLKKLIQSYSANTEIYIISHSHGGTVCALATQFLGMDPNNKHRIKAMLNLGTPIDASRYLPNHAIVDYVINMFSFNDLVQPVWGHCKREYPAHERTANLRTNISGREPDHNQLRSPIIAYWVPTILQQLGNQLNQGIVSPYQVPMTINITPDTEPTFTHDKWRRIDIKLDEGIKEQRGSGVNSTWQTFFNVLFHYSPINSHAHKENPVPVTRTMQIKQLLRTLVKAAKEILSDALSPLYD